MTTALHQTAESTASDEEIRCASYSKSRDRHCHAYGRYECRNKLCSHRSCGLHVVRNDQGIYCPQCGGPVGTRKH